MNVCVTGGTGYMGRRLIPRLVGRGHSVRGLVRPASETRLPPGCAPVLGDALVTIDQMLAALVEAVENPTDGVHIVEAPRIRAAV